jgi:hypothetical protein
LRLSLMAGGRPRWRLGPKRGTSGPPLSGANSRCPSLPIRLAPSAWPFQLSLSRG